jgi:formate--tetrahydrofolate ligase
MAVILRDALQPNLLQTLEHTPALIHAGPFGNIAHGSSSVVADLVGMHAGEFLITEAGFGSDIGAEKFADIKCRASGLRPDAAVLVATVRALKAHSGKYRIVAGKPLPPELDDERPDDVLAGAANLRKHIEIIRGFGITPVVAINAFPTDHQSEHDVIRAVAEEVGAHVAVTTAGRDGGKGAIELAEAVAAAADEPSDFRLLYPDQLPLRDKIETIATRLYGADGIDVQPAAAKQLAQYESMGYGNLPVCMAKTQYSLSHDAKLLGRPSGFRVPIREIRLSAGAGFVTAILGDMRTMPGLNSKPGGERIDIDADGNVVGLF